MLTVNCGIVQDRLATLKAVREAGVSVCAGGIIGLGEGEKDRVGLIHQVEYRADTP
jgi:biotin synthase